METYTRSSFSGAIQWQPKFNVLQSVANVLKKDINTLEPKDLENTWISEEIQRSILSNFWTLESAKNEMKNCVQTILQCIE